MKSEHYLRIACVALAVALLLPWGAFAQTSSDKTSSSDKSSGAPASAADTERQFGDYIVSQTIEVGYRYTDVTSGKVPCQTTAGAFTLCGDNSMYNTFVNLHTGPRVLEQSLSMRSPGNKGVLFDDLYVSSFGWGGDPNNVARLRLRKSRVYNLNATFRRDQNFFNYDLLANPLNPGTISTAKLPLTSTFGNNLLPGLTSTTFLLGSSPHWFGTTRRMTDVDLTIAPQSFVSLRLGYSRNRVEGENGWSFHMPRGTDINPTVVDNHTSDQYRAGLDFRVLPKTTISVDGFFTHNKINYNGFDPNMFFRVAGTIPTDLGVSWFTGGGQPCANPLPGGVVNANCNQGVFYVLTNDYRATIPTGQVSFQSHPSKWFDLSGRLTYSHAHMDGLYSHLWNGVTSTGRQQQIVTAPHDKRDASEANIGATIHLTKKLRVNDYFRWFNWRIPSISPVITTTWNPGAQPVTTPLGVPSTTIVLFNAFWKEERKENEVEVEYDFTKAFGARLGYRYTRRFVFVRDESADVDPESAGPEPGDFEGDAASTEAPIHTGLFGFWVRPNRKFRASFDGELSSATFRAAAAELNAPFIDLGVGNLTRITPRHEQQYRFRMNSSPERWMSMGVALNFQRQQNKSADVNYDFHNYNAGFNLDFMPSDKFIFDLAYNFNNYRQTNLICPIQTASTVNPVLIGATVLQRFCPLDISPTTGLPNGLYQTTGRFESQNHFFSTLVRAKVLPRTTLSLGYSLSNNDGAQVFTNTLLVPGSLHNTFHRPLADIELELAKGLAAKWGWNYYGYNEKGPQGPSIVRDFHANTTTVSLRYAF